MGDSTHPHHEAHAPECRRRQLVVGVAGRAGVEGGGAGLCQAY